LQPVLFSSLGINVAGLKSDCGTSSSSTSKSPANKKGFFSQQVTSDFHKPIQTNSSSNYTTVNLFAS